MKLARLISMVALVAATAAVQMPAVAAWGDLGVGRLVVQGQSPAGVQRPPADGRRSERPPDRDPRRDGRMTDEERRDLRRDIDRANREIYKGRQ